MEKTYFEGKLAEKTIEKSKAKEVFLQTENLLTKIDSLYSSFDYIRLSIASPHRILSWSTRQITIKSKNGFIKTEILGEVNNNETVKFTDLSPIAGGLFCEKIFGPLKSGFCSCGNRYENFGFNFACPQCFVQFTESRVRRYRMGSFQLSLPSSHIWFLNGRPSYFEQVLGIKKKALETTLYYKELFQPSEFSKLSLKDKSLLYPMYFYSQTAKAHPQLCVKFCFFFSKLAKYRREYAENFHEFLYKNKENLIRKIKKIEFIFLNCREKHKSEKIVKKRLSNLRKKCDKLLQQINDLLKIVQTHKKSKLDFYDSQIIDFNLATDFEYFYKFVSKNYEGFLAKFNQQNLFKILTKAIKIQNKNFYKQTDKLLKEKYYEKLGKNILSGFYLQKYSGKYRKRYNGEIIYALLESIDLKNEISLLRNKLATNLSVTKETTKIIKRLRILESFHSTQTSPTSMMLTSLPILPPTLRPLQELENGKLISADLNEAYRLIILRTRRLFTHTIFNLQNNDFSIFRFQIAKSVQEAIDSLIDNARVPKNRQLLLNNRPLKTLTEILEGKEGRFRQTLLGKRVDYSGRSVIVVGPELKINQCGLPFEIAKTLFEPFLISLLLELKLELEQRKLKKVRITGSNSTTLEIYRSLFYKKFLRMLIHKNKPLIWTLLFKLSKKYSVLLNRAPTLHKFGVQAFDPLILFGEAIQLHPLVCAGFNADFDGDQMAVHLPLYSASQLEIKNFLKSSANIFSLSNGEVILKPSQDIVIGIYYLTFLNERKKLDFPKLFVNKAQILTALNNKSIELQTPIFIRYSLLKFSYFIEDNFLNFSESSFPLWKSKLKVLKIIYSSKNKEKAYFLTNRGILIAYKLTTNKYVFSDCFFATTPGRLLFSLNFSHSKQYL